MILNNEIISLSTLSLKSKELYSTWFSQNYVQKVREFQHQRVHLVSYITCLIMKQLSNLLHSSKLPIKPYIPRLFTLKSPLHPSFLTRTPYYTSHNDNSLYISLKRKLPTYIPTPYIPQTPTTITPYTLNSTPYTPSHSDDHSPPPCTPQVPLPVHPRFPSLYPTSAPAGAPIQGRLQPPDRVFPITPCLDCPGLAPAYCVSRGLVVAMFLSPLLDGSPGFCSVFLISPSWNGSSRAWRKLQRDTACWENEHSRGWSDLRRATNRRIDAYLSESESVSRACFVDVSDTKRYSISILG